MTFTHCVLRKIHIHIYIFLLLKNKYIYISFFNLHIKFERNIFEVKKEKRKETDCI